jgi:beta-lactamase regulating signal transducer with metallopeptidase domain
MKLSLILIAGFAAIACLRTRSAALRHWVLTSVILCASAMPLLERTMPAFPLDVTFRSAEVAAPAVSLDVSVREATGTGGATLARGRPPGPLGLVAMIWMLGTTISLLILAAGVARLAWLTARARRASGHWRALTDEICREHQMRRKITVLQSDHGAILATWGVLRPRIVFPAAATRWPDDLVRVILHHEIAHIRRCDWLVQIGGELFRAVYWFNPLAWLICRRLRAESEQACDDEVLTAGTEPSAYAEHLLTLARYFSQHRAWLPAPAMARRSTLHRRIAAMLNTRLDRRPVTPPARLTALMLLLAAAVGVAAAQTSSTFSGTVVDPQGAVMPGVGVTLTSAERQTTQQVETTRSGQFQFTGLVPGDYIAGVQVPGFQAYKGTVSISATNVVQTIALQIGVVRETISVTDSGEGAPRTAAAPARMTPACNQRPATGAVPIGGNIRPPIKIKNVSPLYPSSLRGTGASGEVVLDGVIGTDGFIHDIRAREGSQPVSPKLSAEEGAKAEQAFVDAFVTAVTQWQFDATLLNCVPVEVQITMTGHFSPQ